jgi:acetate kinase
MYIMSVNGGSSSLKLSVYAVNPDLTAIVEVNISSIYSNPTFSSSRTDEKTSVGNDVHDLDSALQYCLKKIPEDKVQDISHVCHRVVHGGDYDESILMTNDSLEHLKTLSDLAPLYVSFRIN